MIRHALLFVVAAGLMEPASAVMHRWIMHGFGWGWHRSHHQRRDTRFEKNDLYPVVMAAGTVLLMLTGTITGIDDLLAIGAGITFYGFAYMLVHDVFIHQRIKAPSTVLRTRYVRWLRKSHGIHHLYSRAPYGFLAPVVPRALLVKAENASREPFADIDSDNAATVRAFSDDGTVARRVKTS